MSREIKCRAWDADQQRMVHPDGINLVAKEVYWKKNGYTADMPLHTSMWYTGIKDKNGTEIYEGDILSVETDTLGNGCETFIGYVEWREGYYSVKYSDGETGLVDWALQWDTEVIGNIYENPEMLEGN